MGRAHYVVCNVQRQVLKALRKAGIHHRRLALVPNAEAAHQLDDRDGFTNETRAVQLNVWSSHVGDAHSLQHLQLVARLIWAQIQPRDDLLRFPPHLVPACRHEWGG